MMVSRQMLMIVI